MDTTDSHRAAARLAGLAYLVSMGVVVLSHYGIYARMVVAGNAAETARNIVAHSGLFRVSIACDLIYAAGVVVFLAALYRMLEPVDRTLAVLSACFRLVYALTWVALALHLLGALRIGSSVDMAGAFEPNGLHGLMRLSLASAFDSYYAGLVFHGLASSVCAYVWLKSGFMPRAWALFGVVSSAWCAASTVAFIIAPGFGKAVNLYSLDTPMALFEIGTSVWLLIDGLRPSRR